MKHNNSNNVRKQIFQKFVEILNSLIFISLYFDEPFRKLPRPLTASYEEGEFERKARIPHNFLLLVKENLGFSKRHLIESRSYKCCWRTRFPK